MELNAIHCGNMQLRSRKTLSQLTIEEIIDEHVKKSAEKTTITPTSVEQIPDTTQHKPNLPSSARASDLPQEEGGQSPTELSKESTPKDKIKAPFLECLKLILVKDALEPTLSTETTFIQEIK